MSVAAVDSALRDAETAIRDASSSLVALEEHPGYRLLRTWPLHGLSARRWEETAVTVADLHADFARYRDVVGRARAARGTRARPGPAEIAEVEALLHGESVTLADEEVPLPRRGLLGPAAVVQRIRPPDLLARMAAAFDAATAVVAAAAAVWDTVAARLDPVDAALDAAEHDLGAVGGPAGGDGVLDTRHAELRAVRDAVAALRRDALSDPLPLDPLRPVDEARVAELVHRAAELRERTRSVATLREKLPARLDRLDGDLAALDREEAEARATGAAVARAIAGDHPPAPPARAAELRAHRDEVRRAADAGRWAGAESALHRVESDVTDARETARAHHQERGALLDRRAELRGRLGALTAKATARGRAEDLALDALRTEAHDRLWSAPCDLAAATVALRRYQRALADGEGS